MEERNRIYRNQGKHKMKNRDDLYKQVLTLRKSKSYREAYNDREFLSRDELRPVRLQLELLKPEMILNEHNIKSTVVIFGSARIWSKQESIDRIKHIKKLLQKKPTDKSLLNKLHEAKRLLKSVKYYDMAEEFAKLISTNACFNQTKLIIVTGGGPGIMEAANKGAYEVGAKSIGLNITLPMEQGPNPYISPEFCFRFHYFAIRKMHFVIRAKALVVFPGGFGTMDELFEVLTLVQTKKKRKIPIILISKKYWDSVINFKNMAKFGFISDEDLGLISYAETAKQAFDIIVEFYKRHPLKSDHSFS